MTKKEFINAILPGAMQAYSKYNILPSLTLAQACLESNWGNSAPGNMLFGIKWTDGCGYNYQVLKTREYYSEIMYKKLVASGAWYELISKVGDKYYVKIKAKFRKYDSYTESIDDHSKLLTKPRYAKVLTAQNYKEVCDAVYKAGYATDINYPSKLINIIEENKFNLWDDYVKAVKILAKKQIIVSPDYWYSVSGENVLPYYAEGLMKKITKQQDLAEALKVLLKNKIITTVDYWLHKFAFKKMANLEYVRTIIIKSVEVLYKE